MHGTTNTIYQQATTALLAVAQHIRDHELGAPVSITMPTPWEPHLSLFISSRDLDDWLDETRSDFVIDTTTVEDTGSLMAGRQHERLVIMGRLTTLGIRLRITAIREIRSLAVVPTPGATA